MVHEGNSSGWGVNFSPKHFHLQKMAIRKWLTEKLEWLSLRVKLKVLASSRWAAPDGLWPGMKVERKGRRKATGFIVLISASESHPSGAQVSSASVSCVLQCLWGAAYCSIATGVAPVPPQPLLWYIVISLCAYCLESNRHA